MKKPFIKIIQFFIGWPLTIASLFFIAKIIGLNNSAVMSSFRNIHWILLIVGIILFFIYLLLRGFFWKEILAEKGLRLSLTETAYEWSSAEIKRYIPGNIWTILSRTEKFSKKGMAKTDILSAFFIESEFIVVACMILSLLSVGFIIYGILPIFPYKELVIIGITSVTILFIFLFLFGSFLNKKYSGNNIHILFRFIRKCFPNFPVKKNIYLLLILTIAFFCYGLGTYFSISALYPLYLTDILTFVGYFVFSLLIGYISFITPMGLGIREGIMTTGLSKFIPLSLAGLGSIFGRVIFIISDVLFFLFIYLWNKGYKKTRGAEIYICNHWQTIMLMVLIICYIGYFTTASFLRYTNFYTGRFDLGNMDQTVWNTLRGRIFQLTDPNGTNTITRLAFHADFILVLLAPFYLLWQSPKMLLLIQTIVLAAGAFFVYKITQEIVQNKTAALLFSFAYLLYPGINYANLYDFHAVTLATSFLLGAFYFLQKQKHFWFVLFLFFAGLTKEEVWIVTALYGLYSIFYLQPESKTRAIRQKILGIFIFFISLLIFYVLVFQLIPHARGSEHFALSYYSDFGSTPSKIIETIILSPQRTIATMLQPDRIFYIFKLFIPTGFISLFAPMYLLLAFPDLAINILSNNSQLQQIYFHYTSVIAPFIFISSAFGVKNFLRYYPKISMNYVLSFLLFTSITSQYFLGPLPGSLNANLAMFVSPQKGSEIISGFLDDIPKRFSVAATNNLGSHLSHRRKIYTIPIGIDKADIIVFLLNDPYAQPSLEAQIKIAENMKKDKNYIEVFKQDNFVVFEKRNLFLQTEPVIKHSRLFPLSIPALEHRDYTGGEIRFDKKISDNKTTNYYLISYPSDGLKIYGLAAIPKNPPPLKGFPVVIINHGYVKPQKYDMQKSYKNIVDFFVTRGFVVFKPDYRGNNNSETDNQALEPLSYSIDVLNLIASIKTVPHINNSNIFLWGHALGGGITIESMEVIGQNNEFDNMVRAAVLWSPVTNPYIWYQQTRPLFPQGLSPFDGVIKVLGTPDKNPLLWKSISELPYTDDINTPIQIDQGTADTLTSYSSSIELYNDLASMNKTARLFLYPDDDHFLSHNTSTALRNDIRFFRTHIQ